MGGPDFDGEAGEASSRTDIEEVRRICEHLACARSDGRGGAPRVVPGGDPAGLVLKVHGEEVAGGEEGFPEVAGHNFFRVADGGEIDTGVPAEQYIDVYRYLFQLRFGQGQGFP